MANTFTWIGGSGIGNVGTNWSPVGPPGPGDVAIVNDGTIALERDSSLNGNTVYLTGTSEMSFVGDTTGGTIVSSGTTNIYNGIDYNNPTLDQASVISNDPTSAPASTTLDFAGYTVNEGTIVSDGSLGSSLTLNVNQDGTAPGYFLNYGDIEADPGNTVTIAVNGTSELFNAGLIYANGGTVVIDGGSGIAGGYAPMLGGVALIGSGGTLELNAGLTAGTGGSSPVFAFYDGASGDPLKLDDIQQFGGRILGFQ